MADPVAAHTIYDFAKDFQPYLAAMIALLAAGLTYRSAMVKLNEDREVRKAEKLAERLAIVSKLKVAAARLKTEMAVTAEDKALFYQNLDLTIPERVPEFDEAWDRLPLIPVDSMDHLERARYFVRSSRDTIRRLPPKDVSSETNRRLADMLRDNCQIIAEACDKLDESLQPEVERLLEATKER